MKNSFKKIVCLAKSRKIGGLCFAGKEILKNNIIGDWIRPVSSRDSEEISSNECEYADGCKPDLLDFIKIPIVKHKPTCHQCENYLIDEEYYWSKKGVFHKNNLGQLCDYPKALWEPHDSSYYGINDRVHAFFKDSLKDSLYLISRLTIEVQTEGEEFGNPRRKVRARFEYNDEMYLFPITDPVIERAYYKKENGQYKSINPDGRIFLCVSIGLPHEGFCYKFVASMIK
jgi:hypothetical protein